MTGLFFILVLSFGCLLVLSIFIDSIQKEKVEEKSTDEKPTENVHTVIETHTYLPIETLSASKAYPAAIVKSEMESSGHGSNLYDMATKALAEQMADNLIPYLEIESDYDVVNQVQVYYARLRVIKPK